MPSTRPRRLRRVLATVVAVTAVVGTGLATADSAGAAPRDGVLESGEFGVSYGGHVLDLYDSDADLWDDVYPGTAISLRDHITGYNNRSPLTWFVYTGDNAGGSEGWVDPGYSGSFSSTFRNRIRSAYYDAN
jgi:hypothetical protein